MTASRRTIGRRPVLAAGLAAGAAGLLPGCQKEAVPSGKPSVDGFDWRSFAGESLTVLMSQHPLTKAMKADLSSFEELTGVTVTIEALAETDYMTKIVTELQSGTGAYDVFMTSAPMNHQYAGAGWIEDLQPWIDDPAHTSPDWDVADFYPAALDAQRWDTTEFSEVGKGGLWAIPANEEGYALFYRKDVLEQLGIAVPQTIDELIEAARAVAGTVVDGVEMNGFVSRGDKTYPTLNPFSTFAGAYGARDIVDGRAAVSSPESIEATEKWVEAMRTGPAAAITYTWYEAQQDFLAGKAAFYIDADHMAPDFEKEGSAIAGKVGYALPPEGPLGRSSSLWLWSLGMNAASAHKGAAWQLIQWATSKEQLTKALAVGNMNPPRVSVAESPEMAEATQGWGDYNEVWKTILAEHASWPYSPSAVWTEIGDIWATAIQSALVGHATVADALGEAATRIDELITR